ncbi:uncharacterized protein LOC135498827 [Lineus longissimus]|uniref:uncharacterized protein LOC135498827 n=1 Tax=Lineus longissimus TaxID=88925 RepID=UPI002B4C40B7
MARGDGTGKGVNVDKGFLLPNGVLKIIEVVINIAVMACIGTVWGGDLQFVMAIAVIYFLWTLLMFFCFLFCVPDMIGGKKPWNIADLVHDVLAVFGYFVCFIIGCVWAGNARYHVFWYFFSSNLIALAIFTFLNLVAYIISLVFCVLEMQGKPVGGK